MTLINSTASKYNHKFRSNGLKKLKIFVGVAGVTFEVVSKTNDASATALKNPIPRALDAIEIQ